MSAQTPPLTPSSSPATPPPRGVWSLFLIRVFSWLQQLPEGLSQPCDPERVPLPRPSPRPPSHFKLLFSTLSKLQSSWCPPPPLRPTNRRCSLSARLHPLPAGGQSPAPESRAGRVPQRPACDGSAPGAAAGGGGALDGGRARAGEGKREEEEVAAGLKAAVSWQLGQALVSVHWLRKSHSRSSDGSTRASAHPRRIFPVPALPLPPPRPLASAFPAAGARSLGASGLL